MSRRDVGGFWQARIPSFILVLLAAAPALAQAPQAGPPVDPGEQPQAAEPAKPEASAEPANPEAALQQEPGTEVIVIDSRTEKPLGDAVGAVEVVDRSAIVARGARNVSDALRGQVGLEVVPGLRGNTLRAQGMDPQYLLVLIDGIPAIGRIGGQIDLDRLPVEGLERIEVVKGPSSALYGSDAMAGVVNLVTREADKPLRAEASATVGSLGRMDASTTAAARQAAGDGWRLSSAAAFGMRRSDGYDLDPATPRTDGSSQRAGDGQLRLAAARGPWRIVAAGDYLREEQRGVDQDGPAVLDRRTVTENAAATLAATVKPRDDTSVAATLRYSTFRDQFVYDQRGDDAGDLDQTTDERMTTASVVASSLLAPAHLLIGGLDGSAEELSAVRLSSDGSRQRLGIYAQDEYLVAQRPQLILVPGGRLDFDSQFGVHATPKLAARWDVNDHIIARAGAGAGYRAPDFRQLLISFDNRAAGYRLQGNPDLQPETSLGATLSVDVEPIEQVGVAVQGYWNEIDNLITPELTNEAVNGLALYRYVNVASARTRGVEVQARARMGRKLVAMIGYALADTLDREHGHELSDRARNRGSFELRARPIERLQLAAHGELVGRRLFFDDETGETRRDEPYAWIGARAEIDIVRNLAFFAGVDNIADAGNSEFLPIAPRTFYTGLRAHYDSPDPGQPQRLARP